MGRPHRLQVAGALYHVTARGNRRQEIYRSETDYRLFLHRLAAVVSRLGWHCLGYCLMPNHYHLFLQTPRADLAVGMHLLNGTYARWFNDAHGLNGHVFQDRFRSGVVDSDPHFLEVCRYVALNPVRAGLCAHPSAWRWSSYAALAGAVAAPAFLARRRVLERFGADGAKAAALFRAFVEGTLVEQA